MHHLEHFPPNSYKAACPLTGKVDGPVIDTGIKVVEDGWEDRHVCLSLAGVLELGQFAGMVPPQEAARLHEQLDHAAADVAAFEAMLVEREARIAELEAELAAAVTGNADQIADIVAAAVNRQVTDAVAAMTAAATKTTPAAKPARKTPAKQAGKNATTSQETTS